MSSDADTPALRATLIGDLVGSRQARDRQQLHDSLQAALLATDERSDPVQASWIMSGDEFQAVHRNVGAALSAALRIRLELFPADVRFGIGWGRVQLLDKSGVQDGPGWWAARAALDHVAAAQQRSSTRLLRTAFRENATPLAQRDSEASTPDSTPDSTQDDSDREAAMSPLAMAVNAALLARDHLLGTFDERDIAILRALLDGGAQGDVAAQLGISTSAISQRVSRRGIGAALASQELLGAVGAPG